MLLGIRSSEEIYRSANVGNVTSLTNFDIFLYLASSNNLYAFVPACTGANVLMAYHKEGKTLQMARRRKCIHDIWGTGTHRKIAIIMSSAVEDILRNSGHADKKKKRKFRRAENAHAVNKRAFVNSLPPKKKNPTLSFSLTFVAFCTCCLHSGYFVSVVVGDNWVGG